MCVQVPCVYIPHTASLVTARNSSYLARLGWLFSLCAAGSAVLTLRDRISCSHLSTGKAEGEAQRQLLLNVPLFHEAESREFPVL